MTWNEAEAILNKEKKVKQEKDVILYYPPAHDRQVIDLYMVEPPQCRLSNKIEISKRSNTRPKITFVYIAEDCSIRRLDFSGQPHRNPHFPPPEELSNLFGANEMLKIIGEQIECPHIHVYTEQFSDKWAVPIMWEPSFGSVTGDEKNSLELFLVYCNLNNIQVNSNINLFSQK